jgi:hypothetical protein
MSDPERHEAAASELPSPKPAAGEPTAQDPPPANPSAEIRKRPSWPGPGGGRRPNSAERRAATSASLATQQARLKQEAADRAAARAKKQA